MAQDKEDPQLQSHVGAEPAIGELLGQVMRRLLTRGRDGLGRAADSGRVRLELRQLQRDRDHFWIRLGKTAYRLAESGEIDHPALQKAMKRIDELERKIRSLEGGSSTPDVDPGEGDR